MENELEVVNIRLVKEPSLYSEQTLDSPQAVVELMGKELSQHDREVFCILNMKNNGTGNQYESGQCWNNQCIFGNSQGSFQEQYSGKCFCNHWTS